jgi:hypothetical protein
MDEVWTRTSHCKKRNQVSKKSTSGIKYDVSILRSLSEIRETVRK